MRVRIALHEKNLPFETKEEDLKNKSAELLRFHPEGRVPLLIHREGEDRILYESSIINEYIEDAFPQPKLMPAEAGLRSEARLWTYWCNQFFKPDLDRLKYGTSRFPEKECFAIEAKVITHLGKVEERLQSHAWLVGDFFSLADIHVFPFVRQLFRVAPAPSFLEKFPSTGKWIQTIADRPSYEKAMQRDQDAAKK